MTPLDRPPPPDAFVRYDATYLRELREASGMDLMILARKACLSVGQVRELESGKDGRYFYSETIKRQAYKRVLQVLGVTPPREAPDVTTPSISSDDPRLGSLDQIAAMSHRPAMNRSLFSAFHVAVDRLHQHKQTVGATVLLLLAVGGLALYGTLRATTSKPTEDARVAAKEPATAPAPTQTAASAPVPSEAKAPPLTLPVVTPPPSATAETTCAFSTEAMPQLTPVQAHKEGRYVYVVSTVDAQVCVVDAQQRATLLQMKTGESRSVYGAAPWQISSSQLPQLKIYFQGGLVARPEGALQRLSLVEAPVTR